MAIILGIKHRDLEALLNSGMTIDEIKENLDKVSSNSSKSSFRAPVLMYDDKQSLRDYCIKNGFNYSCIYYGMSTYGKTQEEAIQNYKQNGQKIPTTWIFEKYGVLLKHLLLSENIDSSSVVARMRALGISFEESIENYIIDDVSKKRDLDKFWQRELYSCITLDLFSEEEKKDFLKEFMITPDELQAVDESKTKIEHVKRKMLLFEMAECLQNKVFSHDEMVDIMRIYDVTGDEVETIFLDLYSQFNNKVLLGSNQDELEKRQQIITYIKGLPNYSEEDISNLKTKLSEEEFTYILETSDLMQDYKQAVTTDVNLLKLMKNTVRENLATNAVTRSEILEEPQKAKNITTK